MDDEMELMLGVRALNHVGRPALITSACTTSSSLALPLGSDGLKMTVTSRSSAYDVTICEDGIIF